MGYGFKLVFGFIWLATGGLGFCFFFIDFVTNDLAKLVGNAGLQNNILTVSMIYNGIGEINYKSGERKTIRYTDKIRKQEINKVN